MISAIANKNSVLSPVNNSWWWKMIFI